MVKKAVAGFLILATSSLFGMSLNKLNTASKVELMEINGIGEKKADAIIRERNKGKFKSFEDFQRVEGIGVETAKNLKNDVKRKPKSAKADRETNKKHSASGSKKRTKKPTASKAERSAAKKKA